MTQKQIYIIVVLLVSLIILSVLFFTSGEGEKFKEEGSRAEAAKKSIAVEETPTQKITLFFLSEEDSFLHPEEREIQMASSVAEAARVVINELLRGSQQGFICPFPPQVRLREVYLADDGLVYVDFSREISEVHSFGATSEMLAIYAVVNTLTFNFKEIKKVFILVDGRERETLSGHVDLRRPFFPLNELIAPQTRN